MNKSNINQLAKFTRHLMSSALLLGGVSIVAMPTLATEVEQELEVVQEREVRVIANHDITAEVTIQMDGNTYDYKLPKKALHNKEELKLAIADLPEKTQKIILESLANLPALHKEHAMKTVLVDTGSDSEFVTKDSEHERVMIIKIEGDSDEAEDIQRLHKSFSSDDHQVFIHKDGEAGSHAEAIKHLLARGTFTVEQLNEIQQVLDSKR